MSRHATEGSYRLNGVDIRGVDEDDLSDLRNRYIGFVFQSFNLVPAPARSPMWRCRCSTPACQRAERMTERCVRWPGSVSRIGLTIALRAVRRSAAARRGRRALVMNPALILADEPTGNLDSHSTAEVLDVFEHLNRQGGRFVLITHEATLARMRGA